MWKTRRPGFTLLEVALAAAVGILLTYGIIFNYQARKASAGDAVAHDRVMAAAAMLEGYVAAKGSLPPSGSGEVARTWAAAHPDEKGASPWGGPTGDPLVGMVEDAPLAAGSADATSAPDVTGAIARNPARQSDLLYLTTAGSGKWVSITSRANPSAIACKGYVIGIYDRDGNPWQWVVGGK